MTAPKEQHRSSIDLARFAAALGIVWAHAHAPGAIIGYLALALFLVLTGFMSFRSLERASGRFVWMARVQRIAVPWLFWSLVFKALNVLREGAAEAEPLLSDPWTLLVGSTIHLWFLPFVMLASLAVPVLSKLVQTPRGLALACVVLVVISPPMLWAQNYLVMPEPLPQWGFAFPPFLYGVIAAIGHKQRMVWMPLAAAAAVVVLTCLAAFITDPGGPMFWAMQVLLAALVFEALWRFDLRLPLLAALGRLAFGIYLVHPFFLLLTYKLLGGGVNSIVAALFTFAGSALATVILRRTPGLRRVV